MATRKVRATAAERVGSMSKGSEQVAARVAMRTALYATPSSYETERGNPFGKRLPSAKARNAMAEQAMAGMRVDATVTGQANRGGVCPDCATQRSNAGACWC
jgi:2-methylaconitate cis-trans-isomerase PrpF